MNLPCKVVEDLLPMHFDCLCSDETAALVEEHLKNCPGCSRMLAGLQTEFDLKKDTVDDIKPLMALREKWQKNKWSNIKKGFCAALAAMLLVTAVASGIWYFCYGKAFFAMAENMERTEEDVIAGASDYKRETEGYRFDLWFPEMLGDDGYARVMGEDGLGLFIYPEPGGSYSWKLYITDSVGRFRFVHIKADLTPDFENYKTLLSADKEKETLGKLVAEKRDDIADMLAETEKLWGIDLLQYAK